MDKVNDDYIISRFEILVLFDEFCEPVSYSLQAGSINNKCSYELDRYSIEEFDKACRDYKRLKDYLHFAEMHFAGFEYNDPKFAITVDRIRSYLFG